MGKRGPIAGTLYGKTPGPVPKERASGVVSERTTATLVALPSMETQAPEPPPHLEDEGRQLWRELFDGLPPGVVDGLLDRATVQRYCEMADERHVLAELVRKAGPIQLEPITTSTGRVLPEKRAVISPAVLALRSLDRQMTELGDRLAASPASRARLGLVVTRARAAQADADNLLGRMWRKEQP